MSSFFQQIYTLLTTNPGNLAYHLILIFALFGGLQITYSRWQSNKEESNRRLLLGFALLLAVRLLLFLVSGLSWQSLINASLVLAPLDRAVDVVSVALIIWLWAFPEPKRLGDSGVLISSGVFAVFGLFSIILTINSGNTFAGTWLDVIWVAFAAILLIGGIAYLVLRKPDNWYAGLTMLVVLFLGHIFHLLNLRSGDEFSGSIRLGQIIAYPLLFTLAQRFMEATTTVVHAPVVVEEKPDEPEEEIEEEKQEKEEAPIQRELPSTAENMVPQGELGKYLALATSDNPQFVCQTLSEILARNMVADLSLLLTPDASGGFLIQCGYDLIKEEPVTGAYLEASAAPDLTEALTKNQPFIRTAERAKHSLSGFAKALDLIETGSILAIPIAEGDNDFAAAVVLISPFSNHTWTFEDQQLLIQSSDALAMLLLSKEESPAPQADINEAISSIAEIEELEEQNRALQIQIDALYAQGEPQAGGGENVESLVKDYEETKESLKQIYAENQELRQALRDALDELQPDPNISSAKQPEKSTGEIKLAGELKLALQEIANLQGVVTNANDKIAGLETQSQNGTIPSEQAEVIASISQELRQPMSSIIGYTDLLLNESVGILGALQRKFLDRVKSSTERMNSFVDDLIQIAALDSGSTELNPELVNLSAVIDDTLNVTSNPLREKSIVLRVDVPEQLPKLHTDKDAVQQIMMHLVQNAGAASPIEGEITLRALVQREHQTEDFVLIQVTDSGGGIPEEDLPRVFSRLYRADNPLIEGVGDTGVGLSIAKTLTEALGGSIWVDSSMGEGATFSVLLPVSRDGVVVEEEDDEPEEMPVQ